MIAEGVIAFRELQISGDPPRQVSVAINQPFRNGDAWRCEFCIDGLNREKVDFYAMGADSMQALVLALQNIAAFLYTSEDFKSEHLSWLGQRNLGFPTAKVIADLVPD